MTPTKGSVALASVYFVETVYVQGASGGVEPYNHLTNLSGEWHIEMTPLRVVRIWNARRYKDGHPCDVYSVAPENLRTWRVVGDTVQDEESRLRGVA